MTKQTNRHVKDNSGTVPIKPGKLVVLSAPSGCGKSTILKKLFETGDLPLVFSVSATNRAPRPGEIDGTHYHFLTTEQFTSYVEKGEFIEWEEVYPGCFYGTLRREIDRKLASGVNVVLDIDVKGALSVKRQYGSLATTIFIEPPGIEALRQRLETRGTESAEVIHTRINKARYEMSFAPQFDHTVINDDLQEATANVGQVIENFLDS